MATVAISQLRATHSQLGGGRLSPHLDHGIEGEAKGIEGQRGSDVHRSQLLVDENTCQRALASSAGRLGQLEPSQADLRVGGEHVGGRLARGLGDSHGRAEVVIGKLACGIGYQAELVTWIQIEHLRTPGN